MPTKVEVEPLIGLGSVHTLDQLKARRDQEVDFLLAKLVYEKYFCGDDDGGDRRAALALPADPRSRRSAGASSASPARTTASRRCCCWSSTRTPPPTRSTGRSSTRRPASRRCCRSCSPTTPVGSTSYVDFDTTRPVWSTDPDKCHISHVVCDTDSWEQKMAQTLEDMDEVESYVKNHNLGFFIPYTYEGEAHNYIPDFIVRLRAPDGAQPLNLIIEVSGEPKPEKAAKVETARSLWVPAVNNHGRLRPLGLPRDQRPVGREEHDPGLARVLCPPKSVR